MKYAHIVMICCLALLQACSFPKIASKNAIITTGSAKADNEPPIIAPRLLSQAVSVRTFSMQSGTAPLTTPNVSETILFATDEYRLSPLAMSLIADFANTVRGTDSDILVKGHTDSRDTIQYNQRLSQNRAISVRNALIAQGIDSQRLIINAFGETNPVAPNNTVVGRQQNRRVEIKASQAQVAPNIVINSQFTAPRFR